MAPKKMKQTLLTVEEEPKAKKSKSEATQDKADKSAFITGAKSLASSKPTTAEGLKAKDAAVKALEHYQSLGRFDSDKTKIVDSWRKHGKKFTFWKEYERTRQMSSSSTTGGSSGFGTKTKP